MGERPVGFWRSPPNHTQAQKGAKILLRPRKGGAVMMLTFVGTWDIGDILSAVQMIITLIALIWSIKKK